MSNQVRLRPITEADLPDYVEWLNDPEVTEFTVLESGSITLEHEREWFRAISAPDRSARTWAIEADGRHIGACDLVPDSLGQQAYVGIIIADKTQWGKGYGTTAMREMLRIGFEELNLHRIRLECHAGNARGLRCYEKSGFRREGIARQALFKRGRWVDLVQMAILREEWEARRAEAAAEAGEVAIRSYRPADYAGFLHIWTACGFSVSPNDAEEVLAARGADPRGFILVAEAGGQTIATIMGHLDRRWGWIQRLAVHPSYRRRGLGRRLVQEAEKRLAALGAHRAVLLTRRDTTPAVQLYEGLGYETWEQVIAMSRRLDAMEETRGGR